MKYPKLVLFVVMLTAALIVSACGGSSTTSTTRDNPTPAVSEKTANDGDGQSAITVLETNAESESGDEHGDGDEHAATEAPAADTEHEHQSLPDEYASKTNPFTDDADALAAGEQVYTASCTACHGAEGKGDGPAAAALDPHPADFTNAEIMNSMSDTYLFWRISEGGTMEPFNSSMPPWKQSLTEEQRWQVILYLRTFTP